MNSTSSSLEIENIHELRSILNQMSHDNINSILDQLTQYLEDDNLLIKKISNICYQQIQKKQQNLDNLIKFSLHMLNQLQTKQEQNDRISTEISNLQNDFAKLMSYNQQLQKRLQLIQCENNDYKNKIQEAETYFSQISCSQNMRQTTQTISLLPINHVKTTKQSMNYNHLTERPHLNFITEEQIKQNQLKLNKIIDQKNQHILELQKEIQIFKNKIHQLENQLNLKSSELELSQMYFRQKIDIIASNQALNRSIQLNTSDLENNFYNPSKNLHRVSSVKSIDSIIQSECNSDQSQTNQGSPVQKCKKDRFNQKSQVRRSLMQDFVTDFFQQTQFHCKSNIQFDSSCNNSFESRSRKKSISISTADIRSTSTKGIQTKIDFKVKKEDKNLTKTNQEYKRQSSFLGLDLSSISLFSKKKDDKIDNQFVGKTILTQINDEKSVKQEENSSLTSLFKGIFQFATKKIVTDRINRKSKICTNQKGVPVNKISK